MTDIVERLRQQVGDDHTRGCQGRCYTCDCGYDEKTELLLEEAAAEIERLRKALQFIAEGYDNQDVNHVDYRVKVYQVALDALSSTECKPTENIEGGA